MPRSAAQSDFVVETTVPDVLPEDPIGDTTSPVELPRAAVKSNQASAAATRFVMILALIVLGALMLLTVIGPHVPSGE